MVHLYKKARLTLAIILGVDKEDYQNSGRNLLLYLFIRVVILTVVLTE